MSSLVMKLSSFFFSFLNRTSVDHSDDLVFKFEEADKGLSSSQVLEAYNLALQSKQNGSLFKSDKFSLDGVCSSVDVVRLKHHAIIKYKLPDLPVEEVLENKVLNNVI